MKSVFLPNNYLAEFTFAEHTLATVETVRKHGKEEVGIKLKQQQNINATGSNTQGRQSKHSYHELTKTYNIKDKN